VWANFPHFGSLKMGFLPIRKPNVSRYLAWVWKLSSFLSPENSILTSCEIHVSRVPSFVWANFPHIGERKMRFLPIREVNIFCILTVCKCELDGLLTESGRPFDGNWTVYWRKLDGLLTETGLCTEGIWTVCWRKVDVLLTETGWSVDGNWMVYWRKLDGLLMDTVQ